MKARGLLLSLGVALLCATLGAQQAPVPAPQNAQNPQKIAGARVDIPRIRLVRPHVYIRAGLKTHGPGQHDYPQFLADWSKVLTERNAVVDGSLHFPKASELEGVDVMVMYKGDAGGMTPEEKATA